MTLQARPTPAQYDGRDFANYQNDPVGFGRDVLGEFFTPDVIKVLESVRDNRVTIARSANAVGKTHGAARAATWFYKVYDDSQVYTAAAQPLSNLERLLWGEIGSLTENHPGLFAEDKVTHLKIQRASLSFLTGVTIPSSGTPAQRQGKFSGKHAPHLLFIVDEGDAVPDEVYAGIESCMSGGHERLLVMFNPRARQGPVYLKEKNREANIVHLSALNHPNVIEGRQVIPRAGAVTRETTVRRINQWTRPLVGEERPDSECFQVPNFLVGAVAESLDGTMYPPLPRGWRKVENPAFFHMVLGIYPAWGQFQLISQAWIDAARARYDLYVAEFGEVPPKGIRPIQGQDVADMGDDENAACFRYGGFVPPLVVWGGVDADRAGIQAAEYYHERDARLANVDATGVGAGVAPRMNRLDCHAIRVMVASSPTEETEMGEFGLLRDQLWWAVREWLRTDKGAMLPDDEELIEELITATYEPVRGMIKVMDKKTMKEILKRSPNRADALCLTFAPEHEVLLAWG